MRFSVRVAVAVLALSTATAAQSQVVASTFGAGDSYDVGYGWSIAQGASNDFASVAAPFTASASGQLSAIRVAVRYVYGSGPLTVALYAGADMNAATLLEQFITSTNTKEILTLTSVLGPVVTIGQSYLLAMTVGGSPTPYYSWLLSSPAIDAAMQFRGHDADDWFLSPDTAPAFDVTVSALATPEPASVALLGAGLLALGGILRARRRA